MSVDITAHTAGPVVQSLFVDLLILHPGMAEHRAYGLLVRLSEVSLKLTALWMILGHNSSPYLVALRAPHHQRANVPRCYDSTMLFGGCRVPCRSAWWVLVVGAGCHLWCNPFCYSTCPSYIPLATIATVHMPA